MVALLPLFGLATAQGDPSTVQRIVDEGKNHNQVMRRLKELTDIGPRLTTSPLLAKAQAWAMGQFRRYGCSNVHLDEAFTAPVGFQRGPTQIGRMVSPFYSEIRFTTPNWMPGTKGLVRGRAVLAPISAEEALAMKDRLKGAWVLMPGAAGARGATLPTGDLKQALDQADVLGYVFGTQDDKLYSHGSWRDKSFEKRPTDVVVIVRKEDYDRVWRNVHFGRDTQLEFDIDNRWYKGPVKQYNVVADIPGTERPDEMVIVCGHFDSWNSPGSQGANDNGTGSVNAIEAARILMAAHAKPKRTIRFVLWVGEEQGLLGSKGYVERHLAEMDKISAVLNDDGGSGYQGGYNGTAEMQAMMEKAFAPTAAAFPEMPMDFTVVKNLDPGGYSDQAPFVWQGVPGFFTKEKGSKSDYGKAWHTQFDRIELAVPEYLVQSSTNHAVVAYNLACADTLLPHVPKVAEPKR